MNDYDLELFIEFIELISGPQKERKKNLWIDERVNVKSGD